MNLRNRKRIYETIVKEHFGDNRQIAFLSGPRQSGKTTLAKSLASDYLNWDDSDVRAAVVAGQNETVRRYGLDRLSPDVPVVVFDELHKYPRWKGFLKGFFDLYGDRMKILATGSAKMDVYKRGGDSMMGRYFPYRMHPFSVAELIDVSLPGDLLVRPPRPIDDADWSALLEFGGFPEPFTRRNRRFSVRWSELRMEQMMVDDLRTLTKVQELEQVRIMAELLANRSLLRTALSVVILSLFLPGHFFRSLSERRVFRIACRSWFVEGWKCATANGMGIKILLSFMST